MRTYSGVELDLLDPSPDMIVPVDIAHALARLCRYTGHVDCPHYSVAQHAVLVSRHGPVVLAEHRLHHDDAEAYTGDISAPMKAALRALCGFDPIALIEQKLDDCIAVRFGLRKLDADEAALVKRADNEALATESRGDVRRAPGSFDTSMPPPWPERIVPLGAEAAEALYLERLGELWTDTTRH
jgi:hypothetical protein